MIGRNLELNSKELDDSFKLLEFSRKGAHSKNSIIGKTRKYL